MAFSGVGSEEDIFNGISSLTYTASAAIPELGTYSVGVVEVTAVGAGSGNITGVTWNGVAMGERSVADDGLGRLAEIWRLFNPADNGTYDIVVTFDTNVTRAVSVVTSWVSAEAEISDDDTSTGSGTGQNPQITSTQVGANEIIFSVSASAANAVGSPSTTDCTELQNFDAGANCSIVAYSIPGTSGDTTHIHNYSQSETYAIVSASFKEAAATGETKTVTDTGTGTDIASPPSASLSTVESGRGVETYSLSASLSTYDNAAGVDDNALAASLGIIDISVGDDIFIDLSALNTIREDGSGSDTLSELLAALGITELGSGGDLLSLLASLSLSDTGSGSDDISILSAFLKSVQDVASGVDGLSISANLSLVDLGEGLEGLGIQAVLSLTDTGTGIDDVTVSTIVETLIQIIDAANGIEGVTVSASLNLPELGYGIDAQSIAAQLTGYDVSISNDGLGISASLFIIDTSSGVDAISILSSTLKIVQDLASGTDFVGQISASLSLVDSGAGADLIGQLLAALTVADFGAGVDVVIKYDLTLRIVKISFIINKRAITFAELTSYGIGFSLASRTMTFSLVSGGSIC